MSNKKSWGDVSSDEDSDDERVTRAPLTRPVAAAAAAAAAADDDGGGGDDDYADERYARPPPPPVVIEGPPYTAFLGNLSFDMRSSTDLTAELESLLRERRLDGAARVKTARLVTDRTTGQSRGYGYVEFDAKEEVRFSFVGRNNAVVVVVGGGDLPVAVSFASCTSFPSPLFLCYLYYSMPSVIGYSHRTRPPRARAHSSRFGCVY